MRFFAFGLWAIAAFAAGYSLFHITFTVEELENTLTRLNRQILAEQESVHILKAEWSYLNRPNRLETLSRHLLPDLDGVTVGQIASLDDLPERPAEAHGAGRHESKPPPNAILTGIEIFPAKLEGGQ